MKNLKNIFYIQISCGAKYRFDSDVYSYGIIFWEVLARKKPFSHLPNQNPVVIKFAVVEGTYTYISNSYSGLLSGPK